MSEKFYRGFRRIGGLMWAAGGGIVVAIVHPFFSSTWPAISKWVAQSPEHYEATIQFIQAGAVAVLYCLVFRYKPFIPKCGPLQDGKIDSEAHAVISKAARSFYGYWHDWWAVLFLFYLALGAKALLSQLKYEPYWNGGLNILMNVSALLVLFCYLELIRPSSSNKPDLTRRSAIGALVLASAINAASMIYVIFNPSNQWPQRLFMIVSGLAVGVALALLVGRFESKYIGTPPRILVFLYVYSVMQATYGLFNTDLLKSEYAAHNFRTAISIIALALKVLLFAWVSWVMTQGRLTVYLENTSSLAKEIPGKWYEVRLRDQS